MSKTQIKDIINPEVNARVIAPPTHQEDPFLTVSEVARQLGKSPPTITRWVHDGLLEAVRQPSGLFAIRKSVVNRFLGGSALKKEIA